MIIAEVRLRSFLDVKHTCRFFRELLKAHAHAICNRAIESRFPVQAKLLKATRISDWLVPRLQELVEDEVVYQELLGDYFKQYCEEKGHNDEPKHFSLTGPLSADEPYDSDHVYIKISSPGPQFLHFLESFILDVCDCEEIYANDNFCDQHSYGIEEEVEAETHGDEFACGCAAHHHGSNRVDSRLPEEIWEDNRFQFWDFMDEYNNRELAILDGKFSGALQLQKFPSELIWYYGVDKLVLPEKAEQRTAPDDAGEAKANA